MLFIEIAASWLCAAVGYVMHALMSVSLTRGARWRGIPIISIVLSFVYFVERYIL